MHCASYQCLKIFFYFQAAYQHSPDPRGYGRGTPPAAPPGFSQPPQSAHSPRHARPQSQPRAGPTRTQHACLKNILVLQKFKQSEILTKKIIVWFVNIQNPSRVGRYCKKDIQYPSLQVHQHLLIQMSGKWRLTARWPLILFKHIFFTYNITKALIPYKIMAKHVNSEK